MKINRFPNYEISENGAIISLKTKKEMKINKTNQIVLTHNKVRTTCYISDLVLEHFGISSFKTYVGIDCEFFFVLAGTTVYCVCENQKIIDLKTLESYENENEFNQSTDLFFEINICDLFDNASWDDNIKSIDKYYGIGITKDKCLFDLKTKKKLKGNYIRLSGKTVWPNVDYLYNKHF